MFSSTRHASDVAVVPLPDLPGDATRIGDVFGEADGCPMDFGIWEMYPGQEPVEFSYAAEAICAYVIAGRLHGIRSDGQSIDLRPGSMIFVARADDAVVSWSVEGDDVFRAVFATYPHYPRL